jgi:hypothetical protein
MEADELSLGLPRSITHSRALPSWKREESFEEEEKEETDGKFHIIERN